MKRHIVRMLLSRMRGSGTLRMTNDIMELFGVKRRRKRNSSFLTTALGAGAVAYGVKKILDNQQHQHGENGQRHQQEHHASAKTTGLSSERKSAIRNIINGYSQNDPGLRAALQEFSSELSDKEPNGDEKL